MEKVIIAQAPVRLDLAGGFTDGVYQEYPIGAVVNIAIKLYSYIYSEKFMSSYIRVSSLKDKALNKKRVLVIQKDLKKRKNLSPENSYGGWWDLFLAAIKRYQLSQIKITAHSEIPWGSGLGGSGSTAVALVGALSSFFNWGWSVKKITQEARFLEIKEMGVTSGWQDQAAAGYGGINLWQAKGFFSSPQRKKWLPSSEQIKNIEANMFLIHSPNSKHHRQSSQIQAKADFDKKDLLKKMVEDALLSWEFIQKQDFKRLGQTVTATFQRIKKFTQNSATSPFVEDLIVCLKQSQDFYGAKVTGAGGPGSYILVIGQKKPLLKLLRKKLKSLKRVRSIEIDFSGLQITSP